MTGASRASALLARLRAARWEVENPDLALRLTLVLLLLQPVGDWSVRPWVLLLAAAGLLVPSLPQRAGFWLALALITGWRVVADWPLSDNHAYLLAYWCLAGACAPLTPRPGEALARSARLLVGLAFLFALVWKLVLSPDYGDGTFFRVLLVLDDRFEELVGLVGGMDGELLERNRRFLAGGGGAFAAPPAFHALARAATAWTAILEALVALGFLWPGSGAPARLRHAALLVFCATTYAVAPVAGFGWLLVAMGLAQCEPERRRTRAFYVAVFGLILVLREVPWLALLARAGG